MLKWINDNPALAAVLAPLVLYVFASVLGAFLPADNRLGQVLRRMAGDLANKNLTFVPPAAPAEKETPK